MADTPPQGTQAPAAPEPSSYEMQDQDEAYFRGEAQPTGGDSTSTKAPSQADPFTFNATSIGTVPFRNQLNPVARWVLGGFARGANKLLQNAGALAVEMKYDTRPRMLGVVPVGPKPELPAQIEAGKQQDLATAYSRTLASEADIDEMYGKKPVDRLGGLIHGFAQFTSAWAPLSAVTGGPVAGAVAMGVAFDRKEPSVADALIQYDKEIKSIPGFGNVISRALHLVQVEPDDTPTEAILKRAAEGEAVGRLTLFILRPVLKSLVWLARGKKVAPPALHEPVPGDRVQVEVSPQGNGTRATVSPIEEMGIPLEPTGGRPSGEAMRFHDDMTAEFGGQPGELTYRGPERRVANTPVDVERRANGLGLDESLARSEEQLRRADDVLASQRALDANGGDIGKAADALVAKQAGGSQRPPLVKIETASKGGSVVEIKTVEALVPGKGHGSEVMQRIIALADKHNVTLTLQASPFGENALSKEALENFYRKFGFRRTSTGGANMVRRPGDQPQLFRQATSASGTVDVMKRVRELGLEDEVRAEAAMRGNTAADVEHAARTVLKDHEDARALKGAMSNYSDEAAARSDAAVANGAGHEEARAASMFTAEEVAVHQRTVEQVRNGEVASLSNGTNPHFNLQSMGTSEAVDEQINALTHQYGDLFSVAQGRPAVSNEVLHEAARLWAGEVRLDNFLPALRRADAAGQVNLSLKAALYNAAVKQAGQEVAELGALMAAKPGDEILEMLARKRLETFLRVSEATANFNTELGRGLQALSARDLPSAAAIKFGSEVTPRPEIMAPKGVKPPALPDPMRMSPAQLGAMVRLFARSGGDVRLVAHVREALRQSAEQGKLDWSNLSNFGKNLNQLVSLYINSIISGPVTQLTIAGSGAVLNMYAASMKVLTGARQINGPLLEEGAAQWAGLVRYTTENVRGAWAAFKENRGILEGTPPFHVDPSKVMTAVQVPGRMAGSLDEFTRETAYRADEFATAFRQARDEGMSVAEAWRRADYDVSQSVQQGIGTNARALRRAGVPTLSDNPGMDRFMGKLTNLLGEHPATKFMVPFVRPSVNTFRYVWMNTPILNRLSKDAQKIYAEGGEALSVLHTSHMVVGSTMVWAASKFMDSGLTGQGPADPALRKMLPRGWQPYSVKIGGEYVSYRRVEPFATFLGMVADTMELYHEIPEQDKDEITEKLQGVMTAIQIAGARNLTNKSWTESLLNFIQAIDADDPWDAGKWLRGTARGLIPYSALIRSMNPDPVWREVRTVKDEVKALIPGWSETLPAKYDWTGNVQARQGSMWNRNMNPLKSVEADDDAVEFALMDNYIPLTPPNPRPYPGIDLWDQQWANDEGKVPYQVWMDKLAALNVRKQVEDAVKDKDGVFANSPKGSRAYPNSLRADHIQSIVGRAQEQALWEMVSEFGKAKLPFANAYIQARYVVPAVAKARGEEAADSVKTSLGLSTNVRR